ncbi:hypothetical protein [Paludisphaera sp.]|uniref:hypothetical protein n=1 Tax=Paludisphaera sp. TaxID=2017432 RepID=UPI00301D5992
MRIHPAGLGLLALWLGVAGASQGQVTEEQFEARALPALAIEEPYDFHRQHAEGLPPRPRDPDERPRDDEIEIGAGWSVEIPADASAPLVAAGEELQRYLKEAMGVEVALKRPDRIDGWRERPRTIVAAARDAMPGLGDPLKASKDYRITVAGDAVAVCGHDDRGAMYGLYNLVMRFSLREAPYLPRDLDTVRHSLYQARMTLSGLGWMEWPDRYLATLPLYGFDAIHCSIYRNPNNAPGADPHWSDRDIRKHPPGAMKDLTRRAARFGIDVYAPLLYHYTGTPENVEGLRKLVRDVLAEFPEIRGYVLLTEGFYYRKWFGAGGQGDEDLRAWVREWSKAVAIVAEEAHRINPKVEILPWEYNVAFSPDQAETKAYVMTQLPESTIPLLTFENGKSFELDGQKGYLRDYAISQVGPAEVTQAQLRAARERNFRAVYSKADTFASWQFGTFPYLPFPYQWHERYKALEEWKVDGTLESWSYGFKPNWVAEMRAWYAWSDAPPLDDLLRRIARREFGAGGEDDVLAAWKSFSEAIRVYPDTGPNWGSNNAVASPLFFAKPKPRAMTLGHSWSDQGLWSGQSQLNPYWPYVPSRLVFWPDFTNQHDAARGYTAFFTVPVFQKYLKLSADRMEEGLLRYRRAALRAPEAKRQAAFREVLLAEQLRRMMLSGHAILEFEQQRLALARSTDAAERRELLRSMTALLREEKGRTTSARETARRDSRLGYEWEQDYIYTPDTIQEKLDLIDDTLDRQIPAYRREHGLEEEQP